MPFFCIHISQGDVATCLKLGGIFKHEYMAILLPNLLAKKIENRIIVGEVVAKSLLSCFFLTHGVVKLVNLLFSVCFATGYIHSGEINIFNNKQVCIAP